MLSIAYVQFYHNLESAESQLKKYKIIIRQYIKIIKQFNAKDKTQSPIFGDINVNITTESSKSDNKLKNDQNKNEEITYKISKSFSVKSSSTESSYVMKYYNMIIKSFNIHITNISRNLTSDVSRIEKNISNICKYNTDFKHFIAQHKPQIQIIRGIISDITTESSKSESKDQDTKKEITDEISLILNFPFISADDQMKNTEAKECTANIHDNRSNELMDKELMDKELMDTEFTSKRNIEEQLAWRTSVVTRFKSIIFFFLILLRINIIIIIIKKLIPSKLIMLTDKARKDKKPEDIQVTKNEIYQKCSLKCSPQCCTILLISFLFLFLLLLYFYFELSHIDDQNDKCTNIFESDVVELEKEILDHDRTVRVLTEYLQRDTPLLKVVALVGGTSVDKSYTVDIIKKRLKRRNDNDFSFSHPNFVVLENLRAEHSIDVINFVKMYQEAYGNGQFTILAVFKIEQLDDDSTYNIDISRTINIVKDTFIEANIISKIIPFEPLSEETLEKYIINTAKNIKQIFSREQINYYKQRLIEDDKN